LGFDDGQLRIIGTISRHRDAHDLDQWEGTASYRDLGTTATYFGPDYQGISVVLMPELNSGNPRFTVYFNADEKKGVAKLDIYQEIKGSKNAQVLAIEAAAKKLATRFPLNNIPLKKCRAGE
jgi:hypothetical protein